MTTRDLRTTKDVTETRKFLLTEQENRDACVGIYLTGKRCVLDHAHDDKQLVRGVLDHEVNAFIGKIENSHKRHINYWYKEESLSSMLRKVADYIEKEHDTRFRHPNWKKKLLTRFRKLKAESQIQVLLYLKASCGSNTTQRIKDLESAMNLNSFDEISAIIQTYES